MNLVLELMLPVIEMWKDEIKKYVAATLAYE